MQIETSKYLYLITGLRNVHRSRGIRPRRSEAGRKSGPTASPQEPQGERRGPREATPVQGGTEFTVCSGLTVLHPCMQGCMNSPSGQRRDHVTCRNQTIDDPVDKTAGDNEK